MITSEEIHHKSEEFGIHTSNVQRDYVFGWLLLAVYSVTSLKDLLILKGGNCFRKAYFPNTRFSHDLDFSTESAVDVAFVRDEFNKACQFVQERAGVIFDLARNRVELQNEIDSQRRVFDVRLYFKDFFGHADHITISLSIDITEFDRIYLPTQIRNIIHPYSDATLCAGTVRCMKLEEMLANKLKCLLQRRHTADLFDLVYAIFLNRDLAVDRSEVLATFFRKTIYEPSPGVARQLLLELPLAGLRSAWSQYIVAPIQGLLDFDQALDQFQVIINELFAAYPLAGTAAFAFFPSHLRSPLMEAGSESKLVRLTYDGVTRTVEPYSLVFKRRRDGHGEEYLYVYDRTGGRTSGPGIKLMVNNKIQGLEVFEEQFQPRHPIELGKAGEAAGRGYFSGPLGGSRLLSGRIRSLRQGWRYTIQCSYCNRQFKRMRQDTGLKPHKDTYGNNCFGRRGLLVNREFIST
jgi:predicted nucleotidyltransferase component of viral defense system